ncbi:MAG: DUF1127 domain-containing protein [SAR324 cluster bacterium]|nr:DUF1127 domain-containing protein [SAR324 cluster bacterium]
MEIATLNYKRRFAEPRVVARQASQVLYNLNPNFRPLSYVSSLLRAAGEELALWFERSRQRRHLISLDERLLKDIGLTSAQAYQEYRKPVWRA